MLSRSAVFQILTFRQYTSYCLNNTKVAGSILDGVIGILIDVILPAALWYWVRFSL